MLSAADGLPTIAHRAAGMDAPENTVAALRMAKKNGAECVEFDVSFTRSAQLSGALKHILIHTPVNEIYFVLGTFPLLFFTMTVWTV